MHKYQLPKDFGEKWVAALRSGEFKQGRTRYYTPETDCYCAMGVGYKIAGVPFVMSGQTIELGYKRIFETHGERDNNLWFPLQNLNDNLKKSFPEIANWIEANVEFVERAKP